MCRTCVICIGHALYTYNIGGGDSMHHPVLEAREPRRVRSCVNIKLRMYVYLLMLALSCTFNVAHAAMRERHWNAVRELVRATANLEAERGEEPLRDAIARD